MITISVPSDYYCREVLTFDAIAEAEAYLDHLELRDDDGYASFELQTVIMQLKEAITEAKEVIAEAKEASPVSAFPHRSTIMPTDKPKDHAH